MINRRSILKASSALAVGVGTGRFIFGQDNDSAVEHHLRRSSPESQSVDASNIVDFLNAVEFESIPLHSFMMLRHGTVIAEGWWQPYHADYRHTLYSLSKSFTSTAIGFAVDEKLLSLDDRVISFFPDDLPSEVNKQLESLQIRHLLMMGSGHTSESLMKPDFELSKSDWTKQFFSSTIDKQPGSHFLYNNGATFMLSAIITKLTQHTVLDFLKPRLFQPLGIIGCDWEENPQGENAGAWGLRVRTEDIAKLGQLYLQQGQWDGRQILSKSWVDQATSKQIDNSNGDQRAIAHSDWAQGYGFQFWRCRHNAYRGDGAYGQYCVVMPDQDAVVAITSEVPDMQRVLNLVWEHLKDACMAAPSEGKSDSSLEEKLGKLEFKRPIGEASSSQQDVLNGKRFDLAENQLRFEAIELKFDDEKVVCKLEMPAGEATIPCGFANWLDGEVDRELTKPLHLVTITIPDVLTAKVAGAAAWIDENTLQLHWQFPETPHYYLVTINVHDAKPSLRCLRSAEAISGRTDAALQINVL